MYLSWLDEGVAVAVVDVGTVKSFVGAKIKENVTKYKISAFRQNVTGRKIK